MLFVAMMRAHVLADQNRVNVEKTFLCLSYLTTATSPVIRALPHRWFGSVQAYVLLYMARSRPGASTIGYLSEMLQLRSVHVHQVLRILLRKGYLAQTYASGISAGPHWILTPAGHALLPKLHTVIKRYGSLGQISTKSREACDSSLRKLIALLTVG